MKESRKRWKIAKILTELNKFLNIFTIEIRREDNGWLDRAINLGKVDFFVFFLSPLNFWLLVFCLHFFRELRKIGGAHLLSPLQYKQLSNLKLGRRRDLPFVVIHASNILSPSSALSYFHNFFHFWFLFCFYAFFKIAALIILFLYLYYFPKFSVLLFARSCIALIKGLNISQLLNLMLQE